MHGMIFAELKKYVEARLGNRGWQTLLNEAGLRNRIYLTLQNYDDGEAVRLVATASRITGKPAAEILEDFGEFITPDLMKMYGVLARKEWRTLEFLENVEQTIHRVVRMRDDGAQPPELRCTRTAAREITLRYSSARRMCALGAASSLESLATTAKRCKLASPNACSTARAPVASSSGSSNSRPAKIGALKIVLLIAWVGLGACDTGRTRRQRNRNFTGERCLS
jgi:hypothetical protein